MIRKIDTAHWKTQELLVTPQLKRWRRKKWVELTNPERKKYPQRAKEIRKTVWGLQKRKALRRKRRKQNPMLQAQLLIRFLMPTVIAAYPMCHKHFQMQRKMEIFQRFFHCLHVQMFPLLIEKFWHRTTVIQPNLTSLPSSIPPSLTPLTYVGSKYSSFTPQRFNKNTSMLDLLGNSSFAEHLTSLHSPKLSLQASIPSSTVGSLLSHCLAIIGEPNHLQDKTSPSSVSKNVDLDIEIISQHSPCSNCKILCSLCESLKQNFLQVICFVRVAFCRIGQTPHP